MKDWEMLLIKLYFAIDDIYSKDLVYYSQRFSNNTKWQEKTFSDVETLTIYLFGLIRKKFEIKGIYIYIKDHLIDWFPLLPSYQKFNERLNYLVPSLERLVYQLMHQLNVSDWVLEGQNLLTCLVDSMPIIMARGNRSETAKVALEVADKTYCASKNLWYHGIKLHYLGASVPNTLPCPVHFELSKASENDNTIFKESIAPKYRFLNVFGDKIYYDLSAKEDQINDFNIEVSACIKRKKGQEELHLDQVLYNKMVSQVRQPVESFFNWINEKTNIQEASKVRSTKGLFKHVLGCLSAILFIILFI